MYNVSPKSVLQQIGDSLSAEERESIIIIGSLAAGFHFFGEDPDAQLRTKDSDCMVSATKAVIVATNITENLFTRGWQLRLEGDFNQPGSPDTPTDQLPIVRMYPPGEHEWFLELLSSPLEGASHKGRDLQRLQTSRGHFALCSFGYFALLEFEPLETRYGIKIASPEMMSLTNLLHHPKVSPTPIKGGIAGRPVKRSNKDIGRVIALAYLATEDDPDALLHWPEKWQQALAKTFPDQALELMRAAGSGIRELMKSEPDLREAHFICQTGLLASANLSLDAFRAVGQRFLVDVINQVDALAPLD